MSKFLFVLTRGPEDPTRAVRCLQFAKIAKDKGHEVVVFLVDDAVYFTNTVTELVADEGAVLDHCKLGFENEGAYHVGMLRTQQGRGSHVTTRVITLGGALVRGAEG